jgi:hypothetical protein
MVSEAHPNIDTAQRGIAVTVTIKLQIKPPREPFRSLQLEQV